MQFLMGLNDTYFAIRGQILLMNPLPSIRQAYSSVCQEEKQRFLSVAQTEMGGSAAMAVRYNNQGKRNFISETDRPQHSVNRLSQPRDTRPQGERRFDQDRRRFGSGRGRPQCTHCGEMGHWVQKCFQLNGYPPRHPKARMNGYPIGNQSTIGNQHSIGNQHNGFPLANQVSEMSHKDEVRPTVSLSETQLKQLLSLLNNHEDSSSSKANAVTKPGFSELDNHNWIIDSGATDHITSSSELLNENKDCSLPPVLLPSGDKADIIAKGSLPLNSVYYLHDVLSVPTFKVDLMSVSRLTRSLNCSVTFLPYWCILQDLATRRTIGLAPPHDPFEPQFRPSPETLTSAQTPDPLQNHLRPSPVPLNSASPPDPLHHHLQPSPSPLIQTESTPSPANDLSSTQTSPHPIPQSSSPPLEPIPLRSLISPEPDPTHTSPVPTTSPPAAPRRSSRQIVPPIKLADYFCSAAYSDQSTSHVPAPIKEENTGVPLAKVSLRISSCPV
uniref:CCHC-type domain-containing protein n=1 Tax=Populus alba TaxID=43335 RepID=A0A4U5P1S0_POPAL|nr:hypothetical protein D5086_0000238510 [Populus alba]